MGNVDWDKVKAETNKRIQQEIEDGLRKEWEQKLPCGHSIILHPRNEISEEVIKQIIEFEIKHCQQCIQEKTDHVIEFPAIN